MKHEDLDELERVINDAEVLFKQEPPLLGVVKLLISELRQSLVDREDLAKELKSLLYIGDCRCDEAFTGRGRHAPNSYCGVMDDAKTLLSKL